VQRKAYVPGAAVLLAALLAACTGSSGSDDTPADSKPGGTTASATAAQPGKYRTLSDACGALSHGTLDSLLPGIKQISDEAQRDTAYEGDAELTYDNDRRSGCRWKAESATATDHLFVDFERVVSYDNAVSDDARATKVFATKEEAADLPEPSTSSSSSSSSSATPSESESATASATSTPTAGETPADLQPRTLDGLGDEAFLDDELSTARQRTVTVVFRTSNVIVTIEYAEQPASTGDVPSSKDMQDRARKMAQQLAGSFQ